MIRLTVSQRETIQKLFASDDARAERVTVEQLLANGTIEKIMPLNTYLDECDDDKDTPKPGLEWSGYIVVLCSDRYMHVIDPWGWRRYNLQYLLEDSGSPG
jgi:hypothetical protein